jgi:glutamyl-tRNA reductase
MLRLEENLVWMLLQKVRLLEQAKNEGIESLIVTSTNRTEIYGYAEHPFQLIKLICENSQGPLTFQKVGFVYKIKKP